MLVIVRNCKNGCKQGCPSRIPQRYGRCVHTTSRETKKLSGNITIDQDGNFVRTLKNRYGKEYKEGIYSPITQNARHIDIIKYVLSKELKINNMPILSLVVMANPKTIINKYRCPEEIEKSIIKYDQIKVTLARYLNDRANTYDLAEKDMYNIANLLVKLNTPVDKTPNFKSRKHQVMLHLQ
ncbi:nuclease-related domain-containing protein [Paenibacillus thiaminolyticus]|uniref:nuclease-related domain-containing protein n=1 Tax=Paenibacillus thiaminolyticus TaxID=49283 RepID=UPI003B9844C5